MTHHPCMFFPRLESIATSTWLITVGAPLCLSSGGSLLFLSLCGHFAQGHRWVNNHNLQLHFIRGKVSIAFHFYRPYLIMKYSKTSSYLLTLRPVVHPLQIYLPVSHLIASASLPWTHRCLPAIAVKFSAPVPPPAKTSLGSFDVLIFPNKCFAHPVLSLLTMSVWPSDNLDLLSCSCVLSSFGRPHTKPTVERET